MSDFLLRDIIVSYNNADSRERIRIVTILVRRYKYSHVKKYNPKWFKDDTQLEDEIEDSDSESDETDQEEEDEKKMMRTWKSILSLLSHLQTFSMMISNNG